MQQLRQIAIDLEVNRFVESKRTSFNQTHNDILRTIAGLPPSATQAFSAAKPASNGDAGAWSGKGATLPAGTRLRMTYNGKVYTGTIEGGSWQVEGGHYVSPSAAADAVTGKSLNGWGYWHVQLPATNKWLPISSLRTEAPTRRSR
jgi:hypothetical protein